MNARQIARRAETAWIHVVNRPDEGPDDAVARYGVKAIPANFLISPDGVIVARDLHGEALLQKPAEIMP